MVGAPGSGKSSLIAALLGEMTCLAGMISWKPLVLLLLYCSLELSASSVAMANELSLCCSHIDSVLADICDARHGGHT